MRISDWSSDVCSSDLEAAAEEGHGDLDRLLEILVLEIEAVARRRPLLLIVEDLHWIDPTSLELLQRLSLRLASLPILLALTLRPAAEAEMRHLFPATGLMLNGLQRPERARKSTRLNSSH